MRTPGTGESVAADEVTDATLGTVKVQYVKLMNGTLDSTDKVGSTGGALDVNIASGADTIHEYQDGDSRTAAYGLLALGDDGTNLQTLTTDSSGHLQVDVLSGTISTITNVVHVDDNASTLSVDDGGGALTVDGTVAISGTVAVTDNASTLSVDDGGGSLTVDGTVAVTNADLTSIKTAVEIIDNAIAGSEMQVDVLTMPTVTINSPAVTNAGTFAVQESGAALTALQLIDNSIYTEGDIDATITGTPVLWEDAADTLVVVSAAKPLPISDAGGTLTVDGTVTANLGATDNAVLDDIAANQTDASQKTQIVDGAGNVIGATANALDVNIKSGSSAGTEYTEGATDATITGTALMWEDAADTLVAASAAKPLPVSDAGGTLTIDGTLTGITNVVHVDDNASTLSVDDGAGSLTVDNGGTFAVQAAQSGTWNVGTVTTVTNVVHVDDNASTLSIDDGGGAITVDGTVAVTNADITSIKTAVEILDNAIAGTEMQVDVVAALPAGTNAIGKLAANSGVDIGDVDVLSLPALTAAKCIAWSHYSNEYNTAQTGTALVNGSGSNKFYIGRLTIGTAGTTAGLVTVWCGQSADTTYTAGTDVCVFRGTLTPSATATPGVVIGNGAAPFCISNAADYLRITTSANITVYVQVDYILAA